MIEPALKPGSSDRKIRTLLALTAMVSFHSVETFGIRQLSLLAQDCTKEILKLDFFVFINFCFFLYAF